MKHSLYKQFIFIILVISLVSTSIHASCAQHFFLAAPVEREFSQKEGYLLSHNLLAPGPLYEKDFRQKLSLENSDFEEERLKIIKLFGSLRDKQGRYNLAKKIGLYMLPIQYGLLDEISVGCDMAAKSIVNSDDESKRAIYIASGADWSHVILATNADNLCLVDITSIDVQKLREAVTKEWDNLDNPHSSARNTIRENMQTKRDFGFSLGSAKSGFSCLELTLIAELKFMGVERYKEDGNDNIKFIDHQDGSVTIHFDWAYPGGRLKPYSIIYCSADITKPGKYPETLKNFILHGIDMCCQRGSNLLSKKYRKYLPYIALYMKKDAYLMTDDQYFIISKGGKSNPDRLLQKRRIPFTKEGEISTPELLAWETAGREWIDHQEYKRNKSGYGWKVNIRRKLQPTQLQSAKTSLIMRAIPFMRRILTSM